MIFKDVKRKIVYIRYVDTFIIFVWGTKNDCSGIKKLVSHFLKSTLDLNFSDEKTYITYLKKDKVKFLGFEIWQSFGSIFFFKKNINPLRKTDRIHMNSKIKDAAFQENKLRLTSRMKPILVKLVNKKLLRFKRGKFFPKSIKIALQYDIANVVNYISWVFHGLSNYCGFAHNWYDAKILYNYFGRFCAAMTIAHKTKSKISKVLKKYGLNLIIQDKNNKNIAEWSILSNASFKRNVCNYNSENLVAIDQKQFLFSSLHVTQ